MILSIQIRHQENLDLFSFFPVEKAVTCSSDLWFSSICASLKMKRSVLILSAPLDSLPVLDQNQRFLEGEFWCWIAPRGLRLILENQTHESMTFLQFKSLIARSK